MELGQIVDFCVEYNRMHGYDKEDEDTEKPKKRKATQADWDALLG